MKLSAASSTLKQLRKSPWKFQQTFKTPLKRLEPFVATIVSTGLPQTASVTIEQAVFEPKHWINLLTRYSLPPKYGKGISVIATAGRVKFRNCFMPYLLIRSIFFSSLIRSGL